MCNSFWETMLAQGIGCGIGVGLLFLPAISILSQYFFRRRALAIGIAVTGSSIGGICLPIMLNNLIQSHGFEKAVQYTGYIMLASLVLACALMHPRLGPNKHHVDKPRPKQLFKSQPYTLVVIGLFLVALGLYFPIFYLQVSSTGPIHRRCSPTPLSQVFAEEHGIQSNIVFYTLPILNAASVFGRISPNFLADHFGSLNLLTIMCAGAGVICFAVLGAGSAGGLIVVAILYGFFSGAYASLMTPAIISTSKGVHEVGIRLGFGFLIISFAALTGTPMTGALLDRYGFVAPVVWSGVTVLTGTLCFAVATLLQRRVKGTWKV
jgi:MFS family permease